MLSIQRILSTSRSLEETINMRLLIVNTLYYPDFFGGAELSVKSIVDAIKDDYEVSVICSNSVNRYRCEMVDGVEVHRFPALNLGYREQRTKSIPGKIIWHALEWYNPLKTIMLARLLDKIDPQLIHTHTLRGLSTSIWRAARSRNIPVVHTLRDRWLLCSRFHLFRGGVRCKGRCLRCCIRDSAKKRDSGRVDAVVGISDHILQHHMRYDYFPKAKIKTVIHNGVDGTSKSRERSFKKPLRFGFIGRIAHFKGIEMLLQVFSHEFSTQKLYVGGIGEADYETRLKEKYASENIVFQGFVKPDEFLNGCDVLIVPSLVEESFGRVIIEAYHAGVPVIASKRGGIPEIVEDGVTGWIFDPDMENDLARTVKRVIAGQGGLAAMSGNCLQASASFTTELMVSRYKQLYQNLLDSPGGS